jgi:hypothetical protein
MGNSRARPQDHRGRARNPPPRSSGLRTRRTPRLGWRCRRSAKSRTLKLRSRRRRPYRGRTRRNPRRNLPPRPRPRFPFDRSQPRPHSSHRRRSPRSPRLSRGSFSQRPRATAAPGRGCVDFDDGDERRARHDLHARRPGRNENDECSRHPVGRRRSRLATRQKARHARRSRRTRARQSRPQPARAPRSLRHRRSRSPERHIRQASTGRSARGHSGRPIRGRANPLGNKTPSNLVGSDPQAFPLLRQRQPGHHRTIRRHRPVRQDSHLRLPGVAGMVIRPHSVSDWFSKPRTGLHPVGVVTYERGARLITGSTELPGWNLPPPRNPVLSETEEISAAGRK